MPENTTTLKVSAEQRRAAVGQFERANQVLASGNLDYAIPLLQNCCQLDPTALAYRQALRQAVKQKFNDNQRGEALSMVTTSAARLKMQTALKSENYLKALEHGEKILARNPWDIGANLGMARAFDKLGLIESAMWSLDQVRKLNPDDHRANRHMARILEKRGNFTQAMMLWELVRKVKPADEEAQHKAKDLAASDTIQRFESAKTSSTDDSEQAHGALNETPVRIELPAKTSTERGKRDIDELQKRIADNPTVANNYLQLAGLYRRFDQVDKARGVLQQGLGPTGRNFDIAMGLADLDIEPFRQNQRITDERLQRQPGNAELIKIRDRLHKEINTRELDLFRQKADRFPNELVHRFEMGVRLFQLGQTDEAIKELQLVRNDPRHKANAFYFLAFCFLQRNNWRLAQRNFEDSLALLGAGNDEVRKEILYQLALGHAGTGDLARAVDLGCELANLDYAYKDISTRLDEWQDRLQKA